MRSTPLQTEAAGAAHPDAFGPFRVLHQIGAGALGPVFRAYDPDQDRLVAVKLFDVNLPPERAPQLVAALQKLIDADLAHDAIAAPLAAGLAGSSIYLAQDFVAADSLDVVIREFGKASLADAVRVAAQLASALDFAADAGIRHGGLHPRDVLLSSDDARLTGLGVLQTLEDLGIRPPTRRPYTAPERVAGQPWDRRADVFSLAVLIAEMLTGRRMAGTGARALEGLADAEAADAAGLREALAKAMAEGPDDRYATATAFANALKRTAVGAAADIHSPALSAPAAALPPIPAPDARLERRLPLDQPAPNVVETLLPGDAPPEPPSWEPPSFSGALDQFTSEPDVEPAPPAKPLPSDAGVLEQLRQVDDWQLKPSPADEPRAARAPIIQPDEPSLRVPPPAAHDVRIADPVSHGQTAPTAPEPEVRIPPAHIPNRPAVHANVARDTAQSAVWPIALALTIGLVVGIAVGFFIFADRLGVGRPADQVTAAADPSAQAPAPAAPSAPASAAAPAAPAPSAARPAERPAPAAARPSERPSPPPASPPARPATPPPARSVERSAPAPAKPVERSAPPAAPAREPAPTTGRVLVRSSPAGAQVILDDKEMGVTPVTVRDLSIGTHALRIVRDGYLTEERRVIITAAQPAQSLIVDLARRVNASPTVAAGAGSSGEAARFTAPLEIESRPPGAAVFLDGKRVGTTPVALQGIPAGSHAVRLELDGYRRWTAAVRVAVGERNRITASLEQ